MDRDDVPFQRINPVSRARHHQNVRIQIVMPLALGVIGVFILAGLVITSSSNSVPNHWASISIILMIIPMLVLGVIVFALFGAGIYLLARALRGLPPLAFKVQTSLERIFQPIQHGCDLIAKPVIDFRTLLTACEAIFNGLIPGKK